MSEPFVLDADLTAGVIPQGIHLAKCTEATIEPNKARDGNNLVFTFFMLTPGEEAKSLKMWQSLKQSVAWRYTKVLASFNIFPNSEAGKFSFSNEQELLRKLKGKIIRLQISHNDYQGEARAQIDNVLPEHELSEAGLSPDTISQINSSVGLPKTPAAQKLPSKRKKDESEQTSDSDLSEEDKLPF